MNAPSKKTNAGICIRIEKEAAESGEDILDVILAYCEKNEIDPEEFAEEIATPKIIEKLANEMREQGKIKNERKVNNILARLCCA